VCFKPGAVTPVEGAATPVEGATDTHCTGGQGQAAWRTWIGDYIEPKQLDRPAHSLGTVLCCPDQFPTKAYAKLTDVIKFIIKMCTQISDRKTWGPSNILV
jgi:hypothetical protein